MRLLQILIVSIILSSCGGGGGGGSSPSIPFSISLGPSSFSVDEDTNFSGSIAASANETVTFTYSINTEPTNGSLTLSSTNAQISYTPNLNYYGPDQFEYTATASNNISKTGIVNITVNAINDPPSLILLESNDSYGYIYPDQNFTIKVQIDDVDNEISELVFSSSSLYGDLSTSYNSQDSIVSIDPKNTSFGGPLDIELMVSDGTDSSSTQIKFWNLKKVSTDTSTNLSYTFLGNHLSQNRLMNYIFIIEGLSDSSKSFLIEGFKEFLEFIDDSNTKYFIDNFFNIHIIELSPDEEIVKIQTGTSLKEDSDFD